MKRTIPVLFSIGFLISFQFIQAQDKADYKFGKISAADFNLPAAKFDSGANAVVIADVGNTSFEGNDKGFFTLVFTRFMRVKILNKNGFEIGSHEINLYHDQEEGEKLTVLKGSTFNLENGVVTETKLDANSVYTEKYNKNIDEKEFSLPALKEGAIFDLQYTIKSPFYTKLRPWEFQGKYPCAWSEYKVSIAPPFHYVMHSRGDQQFDISTTKDVYGTFSIRESGGADADKIYSLSGNSLEKRWVKKNVAPLHEELYTTTLSNYNSRVSFQLNYFQWDNENDRHDYMTTWTNASRDLLNDQDFGVALNYENSWMNDVQKEVTQGAASSEETAHKIFNYIRDNFKAIGEDGYSRESIYTRHTLKEVFKKKQGNVAEINLLLTAMLRNAGITADPVILSTRDHEIADPAYPLIGEYNYVICIAFIGQKIFEMDASEPNNGFNQLPEECYNGFGHVIDEQKPIPLPLFADSVKESSMTTVFIVNDDKGKPSGSFKNIMGRNESLDTRNEIGGSSEKTYEKKMQTNLGSDLTIENFSIDSLKQCDFPLTVHYDFEYKTPYTQDVLYFNPIMGAQYKTNPFASIERHYPVEIPYQIDETYILNMDIPNGYQIDELPKSARVNYNENEGFFEYIIQRGEGSLQMRVRLKLNKAFFPTDEYTTLRDFFAYVVKKEGEQIVFKKIK